MINASRDDVIQCYRVILGREPENAFVVDWIVERTNSVWDVVSLFLSCPEFTNNFFKKHNAARHKISHKNYLTRGLGGVSAFQCYLDNYSFLLSRVKADKCEALFLKRKEIIQRFSGTIKHSIGIETTVQHDHEGELTIHYIFDNFIVYSLSFSFVKGRVINCEDQDVILISRMQGSIYFADRARELTKLMEDVTPQALLFAVLRGMACAFRIDTIVGVSASRQCTGVAPNQKTMLNTYDLFFEAIGAAKTDAGYYLAPSRPNYENSNVESHHKSRTRRKRKLKTEFFDQSYKYFLGWVR